VLQICRSNNVSVHLSLILIDRAKPVSSCTVTLGHAHHSMHVNFIIFAELRTAPNCAKLLELIEGYLNVLSWVFVPKSLSVKKLLSRLCTRIQDVMLFLFPEGNPSPAETLKRLSCACFKPIVKFAPACIMIFPLFDFGAESKFVGMPSFIPVVESYQLLSRGVTFLRRHIVQCVITQQPREACV